MTKVSKKVLIIHYRFGGTDGVALELDKRKRLLEDLGYVVEGCSGTRQGWAQHVIPELDFEQPAAVRILREALGENRKHVSPSAVMKDVEQLADQIYQRLKKLVIRGEYRYLMLHNILSHGRHIAAAKGCYDVIQALGIPTVAIHHDFYWERTQLRPTSRAVQSFLRQYVPPRHPLIRHVVINSVAQQALRRRRGIPSSVMPDVFDFAQPAWKRDAYNTLLPADVGITADEIVVLQATRIVQRKGIELAIALVKALNHPHYLQQLVGQQLYTGKVVTPRSRFVLVLAGHAELESRPYLQALKRYAQQSGVTLRLISDHIAAHRTQEQRRRYYSLWDTYVNADIVTFPSLWEGWGNQFIEAVFAKRPVVIYEYPVWRKDIAREGYRIISLGHQTKPMAGSKLMCVPARVSKRAAQEVIDMLRKADRTRAAVNHNFQIGARYHSFDRLRAHLQSVLR